MAWNGADAIDTTAEEDEEETGGGSEYRLSEYFKQDVLFKDGDSLLDGSAVPSLVGTTPLSRDDDDEDGPGIGWEAHETGQISLKKDILVEFDDSRLDGSAIPSPGEISLSVDGRETDTIRRMSVLQSEECVTKRVPVDAEDSMVDGVAIAWADDTSLSSSEGAASASQ